VMTFSAGCSAINDMPAAICRNSPSPIIIRPRCREGGASRRKQQGIPPFQQAAPTTREAARSPAKTNWIADNAWGRGASPPVRGITGAGGITLPDGLGRAARPLSKYGVGEGVPWRWLRLMRRLDVPTISHVEIPSNVRFAIDGEMKDRKPSPCATPSSAAAKGTLESAMMCFVVAFHGLSYPGQHPSTSCCPVRC
jgi:hypothetical protein